MQKSDQNFVVGIVVSAYKIEEYIRRCVDSILLQTYNDFILVLVDNASPDRCGDIFEDYSVKDSRVVVIHNKTNKGPGDGKNTGINWLVENGECGWIAFIDGDDWVHPDYIKIMIESLKKQSAEVCFGFVTKVYKYPYETKIPEITEIIKYTDIEKLWCEKNAYASFCSFKLFRIDLFHNLRFPESGLDDERTTYKAFFACNSIITISAPLYYYFQNEDSYMHSNWTPEKKFDQLDALVEEMDYFYENNYQKAFYQRIEVFCWLLGKEYSLLKNDDRFKGFLTDEYNKMELFPLKYNGLLTPEQYKKIKNLHFRPYKHGKIVRTLMILHIQLMDKYPFTRNVVIAYPFLYFWLVVNKAWCTIRKKEENVNQGNS